MLHPPGFTQFFGDFRQWIHMNTGTIALPIAMPHEILSLAGIDSGTSQRSYGASPVGNSAVEIYNSASPNEWGFLIIIGY